MYVKGVPARPTYLAPFKVCSFPRRVVTSIDAVVRVGLKLCGLGGWQQGWWRQVLGTDIAKRRVLLLVVLVLPLLLRLLLHRRLLERRGHFRLVIPVVLDRGVLERRLLVVLVQLALLTPRVLMHMRHLEGWLNLMCRVCLVHLLRLWRGLVARQRRHQCSGKWLLMGQLQLAQPMLCKAVASIRRALARSICISFASLR